MQEALTNQLLQYIRENNPDVLTFLEENGRLNEYLSSKIATVNNLLFNNKEEQTVFPLEPACMQILTEDLRPSKYNFIKKILLSDFQEIYQKLVDKGILRRECINIVNHCQSLFEDLRFSEKTVDNLFLRFVLMNEIRDYLGFTLQLWDKQIIEYPGLLRKQQNGYLHS